MRTQRTRLRQGTCELDHGRRVKYLLYMRQRDPVYLVRFLGPDGPKRELTTKEVEVRHAHRAAKTIILLAFENYESATPTERPTNTKRPLGWSDAITLLELNMRMSGLQRTTIESYTVTLRVLRKVIPGTNGPADITAAMAEEFRDRRLASGASPATVASNLMTLSAIYGHWWREACGMLNDDPFSGVRLPRTLD